MSPKRKQLPVRDQQQKQRHLRVANALRRLLKRLEFVRGVRGRGRFGELDRALGRQPGFLNQVFKGRERLSPERLLGSLDFLETAPSDFFSQAFPSDPIPAAPVGFLPRCKERVRTQSRISFGRALLSWGSALEIGEGGAEFNPDISALLKIINIDSNAAFKLATAAIEGLLAIRPAQIAPTAAERLCRVLAPLADTLRHRADRNSACDLLDLAFQVELNLQDFGLRSYLLRTGSYLLSDLALSEEAEWFARDSVTLATLAGDRQGISRSLYVQSEMLRRLDNRAAAMSHVQACIHFLTPEDGSTRTAARFALAYDRFESGDLHTALSDFEQIDQDFGTRSGRDYAKGLMAQAEVRSRLGHRQAADQLFEAARNEFVASGNAQDVALCGLTQMSHLLNTGRLRKSSELAQELVPLAVQLRDNRVGQATLLHILRLSAQGQLTAQVLKESLQGWTQPWKNRRSS